MVDVASHMPVAMQSAGYELDVAEAVATHSQKFSNPPDIAFAACMSLIASAKAQFHWGS